MKAIGRIPSLVNGRERRPLQLMPIARLYGHSINLFSHSAIIE